MSKNIACTFKESEAYKGEKPDNIMLVSTSVLSRVDIENALILSEAITFQRNWNMQMGGVSSINTASQGVLVTSAAFHDDSNVRNVTNARINIIESGYDSMPDLGRDSSESENEKTVVLRCAYKKTK